MNLLDKLISYISPGLAVKRSSNRKLLNYYEAAKPSRLRKFHSSNSGINIDTQQGAVAIRKQIRHLEQNHDLIRGALNILVNNTVGPNGISIEPLPKNSDGSVNTEYADTLTGLWNQWIQYPEVTGRYSWAKVQRLLVKSWLRDGEVFVQLLFGSSPTLKFPTKVPFLIELIESDLVPYNYFDNSNNIFQGFELNNWGKPKAIHVHKRTIPELFQGDYSGDYKRIPFENILQLAVLDRIGQIRGVSSFASVINRAEDIKDYEESERVAAKVAAKWTGYIKRGDPSLFDPTEIQYDEYGDPIHREIQFEPGMIIDSLGVGEEIGLIDSKRPNPNLISFRQSQLKAIAAGIGASYSSIARDYSGTYSSQRQELVEQYVNYSVLADEFIHDIIKPIWNRFVEVAELSNVIKKPNTVVDSTSASFIGQTMPWIDPSKEAQAWETLVNNKFASQIEAIRKRGSTPKEVLEQINRFNEMRKTLTTDENEESIQNNSE